MDLRKPPFSPWLPHMDLLDWFSAFFGFQNDNVHNQREHIVLHLANATPPPDNIDSLDPTVLRRFRQKLLKNYSDWCSFLGRKPNIWIYDSSRGAIPIKDVSFSMELNKILEDYIDENTGRPILPSVSRENAF
ncbi:hypothetical protein POM88_011152 [Heracleum sosnowskyi]|uniref:Uncharacterized protein n=1 Tax=Heracleum sosnowskyi TaxID=360622 RepID=A0AAD8IWG5_9APIA|nr:hypothetical protein POM88_011152 [Heracleum sosnowskyi]